ncbi:LOW QUALITY PROTEIN: zinc FYVE domain containing protein [Colletotrichum tofieldiae]|nr:LOW QUALITY PROTEIN: zinc FYVE domain containing protein [Colletotrichum tofieldiae]
MSGPGKSLLDRLSALKGGSSPGVSLDRSSNALDVSLTGIEPAKPASREDALAARLRSLRNTPEREEHPPQPHNAKAAANSHPEDHCHTRKGRKLTTGVTILHSAATYRESGGGCSTPVILEIARAVDHAGPTAAHAETGDDVDPLLHTDDQTLEDLLNDENLLDGSDPQSRWRFDPKAESAKVSALLDELSKASADQKAPSQKDPDGVGERTRDAHSIDDESEGEEMSREVEDLLSQAFDEARLNPQSAEVPDTPALGRSQLSPGHGDQYDPREDHQGDGDGDTGLSLPSVPSTIAVPKADGGGEGGLSLPSVPSGAPQHDAVSDFDSDIAARMAALGGLGSSSDGMGLPSVPTFQPAERAVKRLTSKAGYTDEDADTWCTVCLEDATLQCLGSFDDRTHKAVRFVKPKKDSQRRVMLGAS